MEKEITLGRSECASLLLQTDFDWWEMEEISYNKIKVKASEREEKLKGWRFVRKDKGIELWKTSSGRKELQLTF